ncbi:unnamed protein product [Sphacelaria rigidula]
MENGQCSGRCFAHQVVNFKDHGGWAYAPTCFRRCTRRFRKLLSLEDCHWPTFCLVVALKEAASIARTLKTTNITPRNGGNLHIGPHIVRLQQICYGEFIVGTRLLSVFALSRHGLTWYA